MYNKENCINSKHKNQKQQQERQPQRFPPPHLSRHDRAAWLILGQAELSQTTSGTGSQQTNVIGDLHERTGHRVQSTAHFHQRVVGRQACVDKK